MWNTLKIMCVVGKQFLHRKCILVCYKEGSDEIVGLNWNFVVHKDDQYVEKLFNQVSFKCLVFLAEL